MWNIFQELWSDEQGFIVSIELILIATIGVLGLIVGMSCLANAIVSEFQDLGWAVRGLNQGYFFGGFRGCKSWVPGSSYVNQTLPNNFALNNNWDLGITPSVMGGGWGPGYAAPAVVAPNVVVPGPTVAPTRVVPCPTGNCPPELVVPCPTGDCGKDKLLPGTKVVPTPDQYLPKVAPAPGAAANPVEKIDGTAPVLPSLE